jgi:hypothetical protein
MRNFEEDDPVLVANYKKAQEDSELLADIQREEWLKFVAKSFQYNQLIRQPLIIGDIKLEWTNLNELTAFYKRGLFYKTEEIAYFFVSYDYNRGRCNHRNNSGHFMDHIYDMNVMVREFDNSSFRYKTSDLFKAAAQEFYYDMKVEVEAALINKMAKMEVTKICFC